MPRKNAASGRLDHLEARLARVEEALRLTQTEEILVEPWKHLARRRHSWRKQLYLRGRNLTARQLVGGIRANQLDEEKAAANYRLPVAAIREAFEYVEQNRRLLEDEAEI